VLTKNKLSHSAAGEAASLEHTICNNTMIDYETVAGLHGICASILDTLQAFAVIEQSFAVIMQLFADSMSLIADIM
tara:strand:- start:1728 stop:1955 length:228 start_codon:yes stop_codon:yes gene_type:complete